MIARYKAILAQNPHDASALAKLLEMYRRYRTVDLLKDEYSKQLDKKPDDWAALVVMGRLMRATGDDAARARAVVARPSRRRTTTRRRWILIGELDKAAGKTKDARAAYDKALAHATAKDMKKKALRALADLALATGDNDGANAYFKQFLDLDPTERAALDRARRRDARRRQARRRARELRRRREAARQRSGASASRSSRAAARRSRAWARTTRRSSSTAARSSSRRRATTSRSSSPAASSTSTAASRRSPQLLAQYEKEWPEGARGHFEWNTLGKLYEETGAQDKAIAALKKAVAKAPWELETQRRLIQLLENSGRDDEALAQYEAVVRAAPGEARFQLELAERYWRRGQEKKALDVADAARGPVPAATPACCRRSPISTRAGARKTSRSPSTSGSPSSSPTIRRHLVTLGEQYYQKGDKTKRATATWKRIAGKRQAERASPSSARSMAEHGNPTEALAELSTRRSSSTPRTPSSTRAAPRVLESQKRVLAERARRLGEGARADRHQADRSARAARGAHRHHRRR